jgi:hypothetical protein
MSNKQRTVTEGEIEEHLRAGTWAEALQSDDRVWTGDTNRSVHSYLRRIGRKAEARQLWKRDIENKRS